MMSQVRARSRSPYAPVAQLVEQRTENPRVGGSIPPGTTIFLFDFTYTKKGIILMSFFIIFFQTLHEPLALVQV